MNQLDLQYQGLLFDIIENGSIKDTRNGKTRSIFGKQIRHKMKDGFPLLTTKKMYWKGIVAELLWFLRGDTNIKYLVDNDCHIWDGDVYKSFMIKNGFKKTDLGWEGKMGGLNQKTHAWLTQEEFINKIKTDDEFAKKWGELGPVYGKQWRSWNKIRFRDINRINQHHNQIAGIENPFEEEGKWVRGYEDQIQNLILDLKTNPDSRRLMVSAWNVGELDQMTLPPCHYGFQVYTRELSRQERSDYYYENGNSEGIVEGSLDLSIWVNDETAHIWYNKRNVPTRAISLMWNQRSVDTFLGLPFNIASYGLLLEIIAKEVNMVPDELIGNLGDTHLYEDHLSQASEQLIRKSYSLPKLEINDQYWVDNCGLDTHILSMLIEDFQVKEYQSHPTIKAPLSN
jgi:thymidylate synthase